MHNNPLNIAPKQNNNNNQ